MAARRFPVQGIEPMPQNIRPEDEPRVHEQLDAKLNSLGRGGLWAAAGHLLAQVRLLAEMLRDKDFKIDWPLRAKMIGALVYFIMPVDMVPDFIPGLGYIDDAVVLALLMNSIAHVLRQYREYRAARGAGRVIEAEAKAV